MRLSCLSAQLLVSASVLILGSWDTGLHAQWEVCQLLSAPSSPSTHHSLPLLISKIKKKIFKKTYFRKISLRKVHFICVLWTLSNLSHNSYCYNHFTDQKPEAKRLCVLFGPVWLNCWVELESMFYFSTVSSLSKVT